MLFRRQDQQTSREQESLPQVGAGGGDPDGVRQAGQSLFEAADAAIRRALSGNSRAFLETTRQEGGE
jgi:hypothetical protein